MSFEFVDESTNIGFWPKDDNVGISRNMLLRIKELSKAHEYDFRCEDITNWTYYTWTTKRVSPNSEIKEIVDGIREICKGIELIFKIENTVSQNYFPSANVYEVSIEELDSLKE